MLKYKADRRSVCFMIITTGLLILLWQMGSSFNWWLWIPLYLFQLLMSVSVSVMTHNHKHLAMWKNKTMNVLTDNWLTMFYGFPVFGWEECTSPLQGRRKSFCRYSTRQPQG